MVTIGVTLSQSREAIEIAEKYDNVWACVGVHPNHAADELPVADTGGDRGAGAASESDRHRRIRAWIIFTTRRRATFRSRISAPISAPRSSPACRSPSMRATPMRTSRGSWPRNGQRRAFRFPAALLFLRPRAGRGGAGDGRVYFLLRDPDLSEIPGNPRHRRARAARAAAGGDGFTLSGAGAVPRQTQRAGLYRAHGQNSGGDQRDVTRSHGRADHGQLQKLFRKAA